MSFTETPLKTLFQNWATRNWGATAQKLHENKIEVCIETAITLSKLQLAFSNFIDIETYP